MRLIQLRANKESFKTITFNPVGVSLIVGKRHNNDYSVNKKGTYNSVGKSLSIALVHFCLGSNKISEFETKLSDWIFYLDLKLGEDQFTISRSCAEQNKIYIDNKEHDLESFREFFLNRCFALPEPIKNLTFRTLISRFIRPKKSSYTSYAKFVDEEQPYARLLNNCFLLGLDPKMLEEKFELKDKWDKIDDMRKSVESDPILKSFFENDNDEHFEIDIVDLKSKIDKLQKNISEFKIAEDYYEIVKEADKIKSSLKGLENKANSYRIAIANIEKSLKITPDVPKKKIIELYKEAEVTLLDHVVKRLEDVESFNKKIINNRTYRLNNERKELERQVSELDSAILKMGKKKDEYMEYLNTRGALDEYAKLNDQLSSYKTKLDSIEKYKNLVSEYKNKQAEIKKKLLDENIRTENYLKDKEELIQNNIRLFKSFTEEFYENKKAGIEIKNNDGTNKTRFDLKAKIDDDKGDGVNDVKIFCFDWTILKGRHNHNVNFLFHDSRLLSEIDSRQVATLFRVAYEQTFSNNLQYIISGNQNVLDGLKNFYSAEDYEKIITNSTILELTDESDESKLLGIQVDLDYDKE